MFCALCLREAPPAECDPHINVHNSNMRFGGYQGQSYSLDKHLAIALDGILPGQHVASTLNSALMVCCAENEDEETWPGIDTTCRSCRSEWLWQRIATSLRDREAVGGPRFVPPGCPTNLFSSSKKKSIISIPRHPPAKYASADWETRQTVDAFIDLGEGSIADVLSVARGKFWLRSQTKMPELMEQAVAATRWTGENMDVQVSPSISSRSQHLSTVPHSSSSVVSSPDMARSDRTGCSPVNSTSASSPSPYSAQRSRSPSPRSLGSSEYEGSEEEEDPELLSLTEDAGGVRELAVSDWARSRILDGHWCSPADQWYGYAWPAGGGVRDPGEETESEPDLDEEVREGNFVRRIARVPAVHPCPWTLPEVSSTRTSDDLDDTHPRSATVRAHAPPSFTLCEQAYRAYQKQLRLILFPAMSNLVRRFVIEASCGRGTDPPIRIAKMDLEEVLEGLRDPGVWFEGYDWSTMGREGAATTSDNIGYKTEQERDEDAGSASSRSDESHTTSPMLSTTTLQTTPSPPPAHDDKGTKANHCTSRQLAAPIPVSPTLEHPKLIHPIPYIPITLAHMAQFSLEAFKAVCRHEFCMPGSNADWKPFDVGLEGGMCTVVPLSLFNL